MISSARNTQTKHFTDFVTPAVTSGTVMQILKVPINDRLRCLKSILKISHSNYLIFEVIYPWH